MADESLVKILKEKGVEAFNKWKIEHLFESPVDLTETHFDGLDLAGVLFVSADLRNTTFKKTNLRGARFGSANLSFADLTGANLEEASLEDANLTGTTLSGASLRAASLDFAHFVECYFIGTDFSRSKFLLTVIADSDLSRAHGLESARHEASSSIGIDTIYRSGGNIPEIFLRGAGVPEDFITYMRSLVGKPIEFYSCFISYSSKDHEFAERLHADLQSKGVRCWFAPEDLKIGDRFRTRIEESIKLYDKLMVVLSENSIQSSWVEEEVEAALEKERQRPGTTALFPVRLDDAVMETKQAWAASLRRTRHIGEFNNWKDHDRYKKAFDRLLRDLKADAKADSAA
jgi:hypothetical protein